MGVENLVHPDSLEAVISETKRRALGYSESSSTIDIFIKNNRNGKLKVSASLYPLRKPPGTFLVLAEPVKV